MYELRVVALSEDARYVVLAPVLEGRRERYRVPVDERLRAALRGELGRLERKNRPDSALTPREIQARVRAGETAETIAAAAGVPVEWVLRFETPVLAERGMVARQARRSSLSVSGGEWTGVALEEIVTARLEADGVKADAAEWDSWRRDDGRWVLQLRVGTATAHWLWDPALQRLVVHDDAARALLHSRGPALPDAGPVAEPRHLFLAREPAGGTGGTAGPGYAQAAAHGQPDELEPEVVLELRSEASRIAASPPAERPAGPSASASASPSAGLAGSGPPAPESVDDSAVPVGLVEAAADPQLANLPSGLPAADGSDGGDSLPVEESSLGDRSVPVPEDLPSEESAAVPESLLGEEAPLGGQSVAVPESLPVEESPLVAQGVPVPESLPGAQGVPVPENLPGEESLPMQAGPSAEGPASSLETALTRDSAQTHDQAQVDGTAVAHDPALTQDPAHDQAQDPAASADPALAEDALPPAEAEPAGQGGVPPATRSSSRKRRKAVPSWEDILLGTGMGPGAGDAGGSAR